jgi:hypothetical protein
VKKQTKRRACAGKKRNATKADAVRQLDRMIRDGSSPDALEPYKCGHCDGWHVGHRRGYGSHRP